MSALIAHLGFAFSAHHFDLRNLTIVRVCGSKAISLLGNKFFYCAATNQAYVHFLCTLCVCFGETLRAEDWD